MIIPTDFHIFQRDWNHQPDYLKTLCERKGTRMNCPAAKAVEKSFDDQTAGLSQSYRNELWREHQPCDDHENNNVI